ncbi:MAG: S8 family serine peptidase, partial [Candidatus Kapaibacterium sp.]
MKKNIGYVSFSISTLSLILLCTVVVSGRNIPDKEPVPPAPPRYLEGTIIIKLLSGFPNSRSSIYFGIHELDRELRTLGLTDRRSLFPMAPYTGGGSFTTSALPDEGFDRIYVLSIAQGVGIYGAISHLMETGALEYAEPYFTFDLHYTPNDPRFNEQYALNLINVREAWDITQGDSTMAIAVCDAGVEWTHVDLADNIWTNPGESGVDGSGNDKRTNGLDDDRNGFVDDWHGWDLIGNPVTTNALQSRQWLPDNNPAPRRVNVSGYRGYHGTWVAGCASPRTDNSVGIAGPGFRTKILPVKCSADSLATGSVIAGYDGIRYAADMGAKVINCSFGGAINPDFAQSLQATIDYAFSKGSLVVASSGNEGTFNDRTPIFPAHLNHTLSVGATNSSDAPVGFSGYGVTVDIWAPGVGTLTTELGNNYTSSNVSGTSFSSPIVAGVAALVFAEHPDWNPDQVAMQIRVTGDVLLNGGPHRYRRVNAGRALRINQDITSSDSDNLPGVGLVSWKLSGETDDTLHGPDDRVTAELTLQNYLSPTKNLRVEAYPNGELTTDPIDLGEIATMGRRQISVDVKLDPNSNVLYSEGRLQLILKLTDGSYEDFVTIFVPVDLPGWKQQLDPLALNPGVQYAGASVATVTPRLAWAIANVPFSQTVQIPIYSRNVSGNQWSGLQQVTVNGNQLQTPLYTITALDAQRAWTAGTGASGGANIYQTTNGGASWNSQSVSNITSFVNAIHFWNTSDGIFIGDPVSGRWGIARSNDGGATWRPLSQPLAASSSSEFGWNNSYAVVGDNIWFGTNQSKIWRSTDRGTSWTSHATPGVNSLDIAFADELQGMVLFRNAQGTGLSGLAASNDGGITWKNVSFPFSNAEPESIAAVPGTSRFFL